MVVYTYLKCLYSNIGKHKTSLHHWWTLQVLLKTKDHIYMSAVNILYFWSMTWMLVDSLLCFALASDGGDGFSRAEVSDVNQNILESVFLTLIVLCGPQWSGKWDLYYWWRHSSQSFGSHSVLSKVETLWQHQTLRQIFTEVVKSFWLYPS